MFKKLYSVLLLGLASANVLCGATYYAATTGSDSNNGSSGSPWLTPGVSIAKLAAGDTLTITAGTYVETNTYSFSVSGTASSPITIVGQNAIVDIHATGNQLYNFNGNCVVVDGLRFTMTLSGGMVFGGVLGINGNNCTFRNLELYNIAAALISGNTGDLLYCIVSGGGSSYNTCSNLFIHDIQNGDIFRIWGYTNRITSCTVSNCSNPNYNYSGSSQMHADFDQSFGDNNTPSIGNIFENCYAFNNSIQLGTLSQDSRSNIHDNVWRNNVLVNFATCSFMGQWNTMWYNNLFINDGANPGCAARLDGGTDTGAGWDATGSQFINNAFITYSLGFMGGLSASQFIIANNYYGTASYGALGTIGTSAVNGGNPQFVGAPNYHILVNSVLKGAGANLTGNVNAPTLDKDGNARPATGAWDIGPYEYSVSGPSTNPVIQVSPATLTFGPVAAGASASNTFTVQNAGAGTLSGTASVVTASTNFLTILSGGTYSLGADQSQAVTVLYTPTGSSTDSGSITCIGGTGAQVSVTGSLLAVLPGFSFPSYAGIITAPFVTNSGGYVSQSVQTSVTNGGSAVYAFVIANSGSYTVSANVNAPGDAANSFYVNIDAQPTDPTMIWDIPVTSGFTNQTVSWRGNGTDTTPQYVPEVFNLTAGVHQLIIIGREAGAQLGQMTIALYSASRPGPPPAPIMIPSLSVNQIASLTIQAFGTVRGMNNVSYDFGDGSSSTNANPVHTYANAGTYTVSLTATDGSGRNLTSHFVISVTP